MSIYRFNFEEFGLGNFKMEIPDPDPSDFFAIPHSFMKGFIHSKETRELMREKKLGKPGPWLGKKRKSLHSAEHKARMSLRLIGNSYTKGKKYSQEEKEKYYAGGRKRRPPKT